VAVNVDPVVAEPLTIGGAVLAGGLADAAKGSIAPTIRSTATIAALRQTRAHWIKATPHLDGQLKSSESSLQVLVVH
jgi:hypothetical protein